MLPRDEECVMLKAEIDWVRREIERLEARLEALEIDYSDAVSLREDEEEGGPRE